MCPLTPSEVKTSVRMRELLRQMFLDALRELDLPLRMRAGIRVKNMVLETGTHVYALDQYRSSQVVAFGKAAAEMAATLDQIMDTGRVSGVVVPSAPPRQPLPNFRYIVGGHPYPNAESLEAAGAALKLATEADEQTLMLFLISGGGSALLEKPLFDDIALNDAAAFHRLLVTCGANIYEMNVVRKHFSAVKGGRLALAAYPTRQVTLYVSDVPADKPSSVASGPTMPDESTVAECLEVAKRYDMAAQLPEPYRRRLVSGEIPETPKPGDSRFANCHYQAVLSNADGVAAVSRLAEARGWKAEVDLSCDDWPLEKAADHLLGRLRVLRQQAGEPVCLISGGELSCPVTGDGVGGRNLAFALYCATRIEGENIAVMSAGTDGVDGNSPAAGAVADGTTLVRARADGLDPVAFLRRSDSYTFFAALSDALITGPTGNNVRDLRLLLAG